MIMSYHTPAIYTSERAIKKFQIPGFGPRTFFLLGYNDRAARKTTSSKSTTRSKCLWYEEGEKSSKYFLNLEKRRGIQGEIKKRIANNQENSE